MLVYLDGEYVRADEARVSVDDRGFLFGDGVYEVARVYAGQPYLLDEHLERMAGGLAALEIDDGVVTPIGPAARRLLDENDVTGEGIVYAQVTRGAAPRTHHFPPTGTRPTVYVAARPYQPYPAEYWEDGVAAILVPDKRWARCDIKSIALLPNVLANQAAHEAGVFEAIFVRDGILTEGSHSNVWAVRDRRLITHPVTNHILPGITRARVFEMAAGLGIEVEEEIIQEDELFDMDEVFLSGTTTEIMPVVRIDDRDLVDGEPGPITRKLIRAYRDGLPK